MSVESTAAALLLVSRLASAIDAAISIAGNSQKFRDLVATAIAEGRDLTDAELDSLASDLDAAIDRLGGGA